MDEWEHILAMNVALVASECCAPSVASSTSSPRLSLLEGWLLALLFPSEMSMSKRGGNSDEMFVEQFRLLKVVC